MSAARLDAAIRSVCPITGVSIADPLVKATWVAHFVESATQQQRDAAQAVIDAFDYFAAPTANQQEQACRDYLNGASFVPPYFSPCKAFIAKAISDECYRLGINPADITGPQLVSLRNRIAAIYKNL